MALILNGGLAITIPRAAQIIRIVHFTVAVVINTVLTSGGELAIVAGTRATRVTRIVDNSVSVVINPVLAPGREFAGIPRTRASRIIWVINFSVPIVVNAVVALTCAAHPQRGSESHFLGPNCLLTRNGCSQGKKQTRTMQPAD